MVEQCYTDGSSISFNCTLVVAMNVLMTVFSAASAVHLLVSGETEKGKPLAEQETLSNSITRLIGLLGKAQQYVEDVVVSGHSDHRHV